MSKWFQSDERTENLTGRISLIFLSLVQVLSLLMIIYQRYLKNLPAPYYNDLGILFGISTVGFWLVNLYLGGVLPILSFRRAVTVYLLMVASIAIPYTLIRGLPEGSLWITWILVTLGGPGILVGGYSLAAYLGKRRLDRMAISENEL